jgi:putative oxidoreductase
MNGSSDNCQSSAPPRAKLRSWKCSILTAACRYLLAAIFLMAAVTKIVNPEAFRDRVLQEAHLPLDLARAVIWVLPWLELTCGACLALGYAVREAALLVSILLGLFTLHALLNLSEADCGCFLTPLPEPALAWWPPVRNALLLACGVRVLWSK